MAARKGLEGIASPTIAEVLEQFLEEQKDRLAPRTWNQYDGIIQLLKSCLDGYGYQTLDKKDTALYERLNGGTPEINFCEIFGPGHILPSVGEFLGYFMVRKVIAGADTMRAAGTVTRKLAAWLGEKGYAEAKEAEEAGGRGKRAARELPRAEKLARMLHDWTGGGSDPGRSAVEDHFVVTRVETDKNRMWVEGMMDGRELGPIEVPERITRHLVPGWSISGIVGRKGKSWRLVEAWNVYPG
ncbi:MAG TPA: hypothetical protein VJV23_01485 [Candidatus Polarisedimenticolia bacterium]|nr:hypothetical protein [Candidatus Polarisedimenticolia bacterium]